MWGQGNTTTAVKEISENITLRFTLKQSAYIIQKRQKKWAKRTPSTTTGECTRFCGTSAKANYLHSYFKCSRK